MRRLVGVLLLGVALVSTGLAVWMVVDGGFLAGFPAIAFLLASSAGFGGIVSLKTPLGPSPNGQHSPLKHSLGVVFVVLAVVASAYFLLGLFISLFGANVGGEVAISWTITAVWGMFAAAFWAAGLGLTRSRRHHH